MTDQGIMESWKERFSRARSRLLFSMGSAFSNSMGTSTLLVDSVNEVFELLDELHNLQAQKFEKLDTLLRTDVPSSKHKESRKENDELRKEGEQGMTGHGMQTEGGIVKEGSNHERRREFGAPFSRYRTSCEKKPRGSEETLSEDITRGQDLENLVCVDDSDEIQPVLRPSPKVPARTTPQNDDGRKGGNGARAAPVKKRDMELISKECTRNDIPASKKQKKAPCKKCVEKQKQMFTDAHGYIEYREFTDWLKKGKCLDGMHPRSTTLAPSRPNTPVAPPGPSTILASPHTSTPVLRPRQSATVAPTRPKISTQEMYQMTFPETETQPPPGYGSNFP